METLILRVVRLGGVPLHQQLLPLGGRQQRQLREALLGIGHDAVEQGAEVAGEAGDGGGVEEISAVLPDAAQALRGLAQEEGYIEFRGAGVSGDRGGEQAGEGERGWGRCSGGRT